MKKITNIVLIALGAIAMAGCNGFLDRQPITDITPEKYFKSADELAAYTINYYETFFTRYRGNYNVGFIKDDAYTDNLVYGGSGNSTALAYFGPGNTHYRVPAGQATGSAFQRIRVCNYFFDQVLPKVEAGTLSGPEVNHYIGEMYVMRALAYFSALRSFGDFPIVESVLPDDKEVLVEASKRAPRNEVARFILSDLDKAIGLLNRSDRRRITKDLALLIKSRVALYEATFEKYHKGSGRVPGDSNWPGAAMSYNSGKSFNIDSEVNFFLDQCLSAAEQVADAHALVPNSGVLNPPTKEYYGWNPYFEMFSQPSLDDVDEALFYCEYSAKNDIYYGHGPYILEGGNCGPTRSHIDGFLMKNGLPIYNAGSGYKGDESMDLQQEGRDERLQLFVFSNSDVLVLHDDNKVKTDSLFTAPLFFHIDEHKDRTGYRIRKTYTYDPISTFSSGGGVLGTNDQVLYRAAEAYLNYIEAYYEKNGSVSGKADKYWRAIRTRAGVDPDYTKTIAATELAKEDDWGKRSGDKLVDATLFNIRRERRCEFIGEGFRWNDLIRWRAFDHLMSEKWIPEGCNLWGGELYKAYVDDKGKSRIIEAGEGVSDANMSSRTDSKYVRPYRIISANNELFDGYTWHKAYYLSPYGLQDLTLTSSDGTVANSVAYQNPFWPSDTAGGALE